VVAENGALLYTPADQQEESLAEPPNPAFVAALREQGVAPVSIGRVIVATWEPHQVAVLQAIHDLGLELQVIFNKGAVMVLPAGVTKASGLAAALRALGLSRHNTVAIGDAENDHAMMAACECAVAVANALPAIHARADWVTPADHGAGVRQLIDRMLDDDLVSLTLGRHDFLMGDVEEDGELRVPAHGANMLLAGADLPPLGRAVVRLLDQIQEAEYQSCVLDWDGSLPVTHREVSLGTVDRPPTVDELFHALSAPDRCVRANLAAPAGPERTALLRDFLSRLIAMRGQTARPHWIIVNATGAQTALSGSGDNPPAWLPPEGVAWISTSPRTLGRDVLARINLALLRHPADARLLDSEVRDATNECRLDRENEFALWRKRSAGRTSRVRLFERESRPGATR
jgi:hypothetical protein